MPTACPTLRVRVSSRAAVFEIEDRLYLRLDAEGRWSTFAERGLLFRRAVDGRVLRPLGVLFEDLADDAAAQVHAWVGRRACDLLDAVRAGGRTVFVQGDASLGAARLERATCWSRARLADESLRFEAAYPEPVPILPPHRYRDLVVLPATGCPNHGCAFCTLYRGRPFHALSDEAFDAHLADVLDLFGASLAERDGCFLGSASALSLPDRVLVRRLRRIHEVLGRLRRGIAGFLDPDRAPERDPVAWARLGEEGLVEATLGLESGLGALRGRLGKRGDLGRFRRTVVAAKAGGLTVALTVLVGVGADAAEEDAHGHATAEFVSSLPLEPADRIYLSPLVGASTRPADPRTVRALLKSRTRARIGDYRVEGFAWLA